MTTAAVGLDSARGTPSWLIWTGRVLSALPVLILAMGVVMGLKGSPEMTAAFTGHYGYPQGALLGIVLAELACAVLYAIPQTAVLGAILLTGYLGGAIATHVRVGENFTLALVVAIVAWAGLYLRDARLRALLPLRRRSV